MIYITSIGRNTSNQDRQVAGEPLSAGRWTDFKSLLWHYADNIGDVLFEGEGQGVWEGVEEQAYTIVHTVEIPTHRLSSLARAYGQRAIAVTSGETKFVTYM